MKFAAFQLQFQLTKTTLVSCISSQHTSLQAKQHTYCTLSAENKTLEFQVWTWYEIRLSKSHSLVKTAFRAAIGIVNMIIYATFSLPPYMYYTTTVTIELHIYHWQFNHVVTGHMHAVSKWPQCMTSEYLLVLHKCFLMNICIQRSNQLPVACIPLCKYPTPIFSKVVYFCGSSV